MSQIATRQVVFVDVVGVGKHRDPKAQDRDDDSGEVMLLLRMEFRSRRRGNFWSVVNSVEFGGI